MVIRPYVNGPSPQAKVYIKITVSDVPKDFKCKSPSHKTSSSLHRCIKTILFGLRRRKTSLSLYNWRFLEIYKAFEKMVGKTSQSVFVYSDAVRSGIVGNQISDLLQGIK